MSKHTKGQLVLVEIANDYEQYMLYSEVTGKSVATSVEGQANAERLCRAWNSHDELVAACKAQHDAIDRLFGVLLMQDVGFLPSKCGQPWDAMQQGHEAIAHAEE